MRVICSDCFAGSASTAVAAYNQNRDFIDVNYLRNIMMSIKRLKSLGIIKG